MFKIKKAAAAVAAAILFSGAMVSCEDDNNGAELIGIIPVYTGETITTTTHEFKNEEFAVIASYSDGTDKELEADDFEVTVDGMDAGYYILTVTYEDQENECFVPMELSIYPSDNGVG